MATIVKTLEVYKLKVRGSILPGGGKLNKT